MRLWDMWGALWTVEALVLFLGVLATPLDPVPQSLGGEEANRNSCLLAYFQLVCKGIGGCLHLQNDDVTCYHHYEIKREICNV
ncbi:unnamed protein product [Danaus chrysippus]|uniref:(African queen) hypothetical protein n=1 Tax=Danaus chrysippus TaxID=151541 RepID=A0A8J2QEI2_9NEOP|nr:unnamed protein product [Danaus chrysippus]